MSDEILHIPFGTLEIHFIDYAKKYNISQNVEADLVILFK